MSDNRRTKALLCILNTIVLFGGVALEVIPLALPKEDTDYSINADNYIMFSYGKYMIAVALGCYLAKKYDILFLLIVYCMAMLILAISKAVIVVSIIYFQVTEDLKYTHSLLLDMYGAYGEEYSYLVLWLNRIQQRYGCCGLNGPTGPEVKFFYYKEDFPGDPEPPAYEEEQGNETNVEDRADYEVYVPGRLMRSCCPHLDTVCMVGAAFKEGCFRRIVSILKWVDISMGFSMLVFVIIEFACVICAFRIYWKEYGYNN